MRYENSLALAVKMMQKKICKKKRRNVNKNIFQFSHTAKHKQISNTPVRMLLQ